VVIVENNLNPKQDTEQVTTIYYIQLFISVIQY